MIGGMNKKHHQDSDNTWYKVIGTESVGSQVTKIKNYNDEKYDHICVMILLCKPPNSEAFVGD